ncbi:hypothetical protein H4R19_001670 [Coemansia spiralis]|nr:hypothetical protein H4R19_001670 [Coemansia spiralis]
MQRLVNISDRHVNPSAPGVVIKRMAVWIIDGIYYAGPNPPEFVDDIYDGAN